MMNWIDFTFTTAATTVALIAIFEGVRQLSRSLMNKVGIALFVAGLFWCSCGVAWMLYGSWTMQAMAQTARNSHVQELPRDWGSDRSPENREKDSVSYVSSAYLSSGVVLQHFDREGKLVTFSPSPMQLKEREGFLVNVARLEAQAGNAWDQGLRLGISAIVAALLGWLAARYGSPSQSSKRDA